MGACWLPRTCGRLRLIQIRAAKPCWILSLWRARLLRSGVANRAIQARCTGIWISRCIRNFAENHLLYLTYTKPLDGGKRTTAVARGRWDGSALVDVKDIFVLPEASTSRIAFGSDGKLYFTTTGKDPQDPNTLGGKVLRLWDDGSVPPDNPFVGKAGHRAEVYTLGHRSALGLAVNPPPARCGRTKMVPTAETRSIS